MTGLRIISNCRAKPFAKDCATTAPVVRRLLGAERIERLLQLKRVCDPAQVLQTDLFRRLFPSS